MVSAPRLPEYHDDDAIVRTEEAINYAGREPKPFAVYTLDCSNPYLNKRDFEKRALEVIDRQCFNHGYVPDWMWRAYHSNDIEYIGQTGNINRRLLEHIKPGNTLFTSLFPPIRIKSIEWVGSRTDAVQRERSMHTARQREADEEEFVYSA